MLKAVFCTLTVLVAAYSYAQQPSVYTRTYSFTTNDGKLYTGLRISQNDIIFVKSTGTATYGPLAAVRLGELTAAGSDKNQYESVYVQWSKQEYAQEKFGAVVCRIGDGSPYATSLKRDFRECLQGVFDVGVCAVTDNPVVGALFIAEQDGELWFDINDRWPFDNKGIFTLELTVLSAAGGPFEYSQYNASQSTGCGLIMAANPNGNAYNTQQMQQIVQTGNTSQLTGFAALNSYYRFLNEHRLVRNAGIRWQQVAIEVTGLLLRSNQMMDQLKTPSYNLNLDAAKLTIWVSYLILSNKSGRRFMDGTASSGLVNDITNRFYRPLIRGEIVVKDPFRFDIMAVFAEQYNPDLQRYYTGFSAFDRVLIEGAFSRWFARQPGCINPGGPPMNTPIDIANPADRLRVGLFKMGYTTGQIQLAVSEVNTLASKGMGYTDIIETLKKTAVQPATVLIK